MFGLLAVVGLPFPVVDCGAGRCDASEWLVNTTFALTLAALVCSAVINASPRPSRVSKPPHARPINKRQPIDRRGGAPLEKAASTAGRLGLARPKPKSPRPPSLAPPTGQHTSRPRRSRWGGGLPHSRSGYAGRPQKYAEPAAARCRLSCFRIGRRERSIRID